MKEIVVRHAEIEDAQALLQIYAQPAVYGDTLQLPHPPLHAWTERITSPKPGSRNLVACIDGKVVGQLTLLVEQSPRRSHVATFGMGVDGYYQGKGVATALLTEMVNLCDNWLRIERIELTVFVDNEAALAVYRKFGFAVEGTGKNFALRDGKYVDAYFMARFRPV
ncbi:N-acetyltransferase [Enterobacteriaceae bacterium H20N1]|uniref:N-acetyltransferase n=1 Tax=Dryocola boscaweniae TaxID=2925397 RepID=A0A9X2WC29_9ENTR|nr:N-acetyltransferase [Dryocola boscaweniae]MCT4703424.1 N-acetyltransferase [Dryocola boscaweniae]MCT4720592.1 N-acetyltransferase [Dryocola boscaweniae]